MENERQVTGVAIRDGRSIIVSADYRHRISIL
jgi:hypothetical protein